MHAGGRHRRLCIRQRHASDRSDAPIYINLTARRPPVSHTAVDYYQSTTSLETWQLCSAFIRQTSRPWRLDKTNQLFIVDLLDIYVIVAVITTKACLRNSGWFYMITMWQKPVETSITITWYFLFLHVNVAITSASVTWKQVGFTSKKTRNIFATT